MYTYLKSKVSCVKFVTDAKGLGNVVNIKIHTSNESLAMAQVDVPLRELKSRNPDAKSRRSNRLRTSKSCFLDQLKCKLDFPKGGRCYIQVLCVIYSCYTY